MKSAPTRILVVDRDVKYREWLRLHLGILYPEAAIGSLDPTELESLNGHEGGRACDALVLSADFGSGSDEVRSEGLTLVRALRAIEAAPVIIALAERGDEITAVRAVRAGAADYLPKRLVTPARLKAAVAEALRQTPQPQPGIGDSQTTCTFAVPEPAPEPAQPAEPAPVAAGSAHPVITGYAIVRKLSESEKAVVYLAESQSLGTAVALKVSKIPYEGRAMQALEREYQAILAVQDPAVVRIFDHGNEGGYEYLAMEYFPHGDLKSRMQVGVTESEAVRFLEKIAVALSVVHRAGLLHRDLKPPNVMLRDNDNVVLIDFGLARLLDVTHHSTYTGVLRGSPYYMSPEQALGEKLDPRSDLYSLGVIFHEMLTGRKPFTGTSAMEVLQQHVNSSPPRLPPALSRYAPLLGRLLAKQRESRFSSADEVIVAAVELRRGGAGRAQSAA